MRHPCLTCVIFFLPPRRLLSCLCRPIAYRMSAFSGLRRIAPKPTLSSSIPLGTSPTAPSSIIAPPPSDYQASFTIPNFIQSYAPAPPVPFLASLEILTAAAAARRIPEVPLENQLIRPTTTMYVTVFFIAFVFVYKQSRTKKEHLRNNFISPSPLVPLSLRNHGYPRTEFMDRHPSALSQPRRPPRRSV